MRDRSNHRGHGEKDHNRFVEWSEYLCVLCGRYFFLVLLAPLLIAPSTARNQNRQPTPPGKRIRYDIKLALNFDERTYTGSEQVLITSRQVKRMSWDRSLQMNHVWKYPMCAR